MHYRRTLMVLSCLMALCSLGYASPSIFGPQGLLLTPTADTPGVADLQLGAWWADGVANSVALTSGEGSGFESTAAWVDLEGQGSEEVFSGKWRFRNNSFTQPAFAVGLIDITNQLDRTPYVVLQKGFDLSGNGLMAIVGYAQPDTLLNGIFAGAQLKLGDKYSALAEYDGDDLNGAVRFSLSDHVELTAGLVKNDFAASAMFKLK